MGYMELFPEAARVEKIHWSKRQGILDGAIANLSPIATTGRRFREVAEEEVCGLMDGPISVEVVASRFDVAEQLFHHPMADLAPEQFLPTRERVRQ